MAPLSRIRLYAPGIFVAYYIECDSDSRHLAEQAMLFQSGLALFTRPVRVLRGFRKENLRPDLIAGVTVAVILLPQAIAYATIAQVPPQMGLYAAFVAAIIGAL